MLTTIPAKTIYKSLSRQVTLNYEPLYYPGRRCKRAESLLQNPLLSSPPTPELLLAYARISREILGINMYYKSLTRR